MTNRRGATADNEKAHGPHIPFALAVFALAGAGFLASSFAVSRPGAATGYRDLVALVREFREFAKPAVVDGVPDYTPRALAAWKARVPEFRRRLAALDLSGWSVPERVDAEVLRAEINSLEFDLDILRPWSRIPTFYAVIQASEPDVPRREGPEIFGVLDLWTYAFPLDGRGAAELGAKLAAIPAVLAQARANLVEDARDLYATGIRQKAEESAELVALAERLRASRPALAELAERARAAVDGFRAWLEKRHAAMTAPSGIGMAAFDRYQRDVHLVPYTWAEQKVLAERELERALAQLALEERRNRALPPLVPPATDDEVARRFKADVAYFMNFLRAEEIFSVPGYMRLGDSASRLVPPEHRDFFTEVQYRDFLPLLCHSVHWLEKQRETRNTHPVRSVPPAGNIWDSRAEGFATAFEELMLHAGLFERNPRARELVYVLAAFRAIRALCDLKLHSGEWTMEEAAAFAAKTTPFGWCRADGPTIRGDLAIYLAQPGYGTSYVVGKIQFERLLADRASQLGNRFTLKGFLDDYFARGIIPASLLRWEMTGLDDEMKALGLKP